MKKKILILFGCLVIISCSKKESIEDSYIKENLSKILGLEKNEIEDFKSTMTFNEEGNLISWNSNILEKVYNNEEDYAYILTYIFTELGGYIPPEIVIFDKDSNETIFYPGFQDIYGTKYLLSEISKWNSVFYITSLNCGSCITEFKKMNELENKYRSKNIKFIAVLDMAQNLDNYKKGSTYQIEGVLNENWIVLDKNRYLSFLNKNYKDELGFPFVFFRKNNSELEMYPNAHDYEVISEIIEENF